MGLYGICFRLTSSTHSVEHVERRIANFVDNFTVSEADFEMAKAALVAQALKKPASLQESFIGNMATVLQRVFNFFADKEYKAQTRATQAVSYSAFLTYLNEVKSRPRLWVSVIPRVSMMSKIPGWGSSDTKDNKIAKMLGFTDASGTEGITEVAEYEDLHLSSEYEHFESVETQEY